jgi:hypothetical protein
MDALMNQLIFILNAVVAAEIWNNSGYISEWRKYRNDPTWTGFDKKALKHDLILGGVLGVGVVIYQAASVGTNFALSIPDYTSFSVFVTFGTVLFAIVAIVDKFIVGGFIGIESRTTSPVPASFVADNTLLSSNKITVTVPVNSSTQVVQPEVIDNSQLTPEN